MEYITDTAREHQDRNGCIRTFTGLYVNPLALTLEDIEIVDIAHQLSNECRYIGACPKFYSVAQHSVLVSELFWEPKLALAGLLHDASEAYLKDMPSPVKHAPEMAFYRKCELNALTCIFKRFGLDMAWLNQIKWADDLLFKQEVASWWGAPEDKAITPWSPEGAKKQFLTAFTKYRSLIEKDQYANV